MGKPPLRVLIHFHYEYHNGMLVLVAVITIFCSSIYYLERYSNKQFKRKGRREKHSFNCPYEVLLVFLMRQGKSCEERLLGGIEDAHVTYNCFSG